MDEEGVGIQVLPSGLNNDDITVTKFPMHNNADAADVDDMDAQNVRAMSPTSSMTYTTCMGITWTKKKRLAFGFGAAASFILATALGTSLSKYQRDSIANSIASNNNNAVALKKCLAMPQYEAYAMDTPTFVPTTYVPTSFPTTYVPTSGGGGEPIDADVADDAPFEQNVPTAEMSSTSNDDDAIILPILYDDQILQDYINENENTDKNENNVRKRGLVDGEVGSSGKTVSIYVVCVCMYLYINLTATLLPLPCSLLFSLPSYNIVRRTCL
jgi:hypothetical protein